MVGEALYWLHRGFQAVAHHVPETLTVLLVVATFIVLANAR